MMRPNLAPLAVDPGAAGVALAQPRPWRPPRALVPGVAGGGLLQTAIYGSPLRSGYGDLGQLFSLELRRAPTS